MKMSEKEKNYSAPSKTSEPGEGLRSLKTTGVFRAVNFELYVKQNKVVMAMGLLAFTISIGYLAYMRTKYDNLGYYTAVGENGEQVIRQKQSRWEM